MRGMIENGIRFRNFLLKLLGFDCRVQGGCKGIDIVASEIFE